MVCCDIGWLSVVVDEVSHTPSAPLGDTLPRMASQSYAICMGKLISQLHLGMVTGPFRECGQGMQIIQPGALLGTE